MARSLRTDQRLARLLAVLGGRFSRWPKQQSSDPDRTIQRGVNAEVWGQAV